MTLIFTTENWWAKQIYENFLKTIRKKAKIGGTVCDCRQKVKTKLWKTGIIRASVKLQKIVEINEQQRSFGISQKRICGSFSIFADACYYQLLNNDV